MKLTKKAYAKLNLSLNVAGILDNGYHSIESVFQSVSLCDEITVQATKSGIVVECDNELLSGSNNICFLAAAKFFEKTKHNEGVKIVINKGIPTAAGLGGGSADAAAVLIMLNQLFSYPLSQDELLSLGLNLGADVPFCIVGGTMYVAGIGEVLKATFPMPECDIVIVKNGQKPSTKELYARLDEKENIPHPNINEMLKALESGKVNGVAQNAENSFSSVWGEEIKGIKNELLKLGALGAELSGSGPSVFGIFKFGEGQMAYKQLKEKYEQVYICNPTFKGVE